MHQIIIKKFSNRRIANEEKQKKLTEFMFVNTKNVKKHMGPILHYTLT